ncbi:MAG: cupin domain-containing protein [Candidatus Pacebacteria bacterium]|nr:cupin domain-containing protein [Candidatus Paceibacterota bacterium]MCF7862795.1 cupin domain-containing protein [Candidatus Paceibacterota bacterium]
MFNKKNIQNIPTEQTSHNSGSRKMLTTKEEVDSRCFEAFTYGFLPPKEKWVMHKHENIVEICLVVKGSGVIRNLKGETEKFESGDRFIFPSDIEHEIENLSEETAEFYFFRIQCI